MHRIIVVGGGAGGLELATRLGDRFGARRAPQRVSVVLVDRYPTHIWKPLLHEVAAGSMDPFTHQIEYAAQARWHGFEFQQGELRGLSRVAKTIRVSAVRDEEGIELLPERTLAYDTLVIAIGSTTHFFGVTGAAQHAIALDTVAQAERFRRRLIAACMRAQRPLSSVDVAADGAPRSAVPHPQARGQGPLPSSAASLAHGGTADSAYDGAAGPTHGGTGGPRIQIAIVGGGATGVELSAELRNTAHVLAAYGLHKLHPVTDIGIVLIEAGPRILPALPERVSAATAALLRRLNVSVITGEAVSEVRVGEVVTGSGNVLRADLTVWAAGIKAPPVLALLDGLAVNKLGQLVVRSTLQTTSDDDIFALGDCAACPWPEAKRTVPPRAQAAHQQANFLFNALRARLDGRALPTYTYRDLGSLVSLGHNAIGNLMGGLIGKSLFVEGLFARFMYQLLYRMHIAALHGYGRMLLDTLAHGLRRTTRPRVKLH
ncbi:NAD(P)/FAD-dependent oxidoreductase [Mycetohabitans sp. B6]|uniref:NAD(P)/FAD-dependent oxidoreductase n=1 Tax=Mycetohabitans sp. B6 TaxID=2841843 RepID=UPI001F1E39BF|nr:NAD(P)/FAD-dependent oxidoreductase [Mycetohabitans sp. B6]MCG1046634.1 NAD(P)/FAD-dependent oxidoreductase [Mycetohabitans sp. B6]